MNQIDNDSFALLCFAHTALHIAMGPIATNQSPTKTTANVKLKCLNRSHFMLLLISGFCLHCAICSCINAISIVGFARQYSIWNNVCVEGMRKGAAVGSSSSSSK